MRGFRTVKMLHLETVPSPIQQPLLLCRAGHSLACPPLFCPSNVQSSILHQTVSRHPFPVLPTPSPCTSNKIGKFQTYFTIVNARSSFTSTESNYSIHFREYFSNQGFARHQIKWKFVISFKYAKAFRIAKAFTES